MSYANKKTGEVISNNDYKALNAKKRKDYKRFDQATNQIHANPSIGTSTDTTKTPRPGSDWAK